MTSSIDKSWNKARFDWKKRVNRSQNLSRGAKCLGSFLCDEYVGRNTGRCWPSNQTIGQALGVTKRTVQRYLAELAGDGWIVFPLVPRRRRTIQLSFPACNKGDIKGDKELGKWATQLTNNRDTDVIPHKNQVNNQSKGVPNNAVFQTVQVLESETSIVEGWKFWITKHTDHHAQELFELLRKNGAYLLPRRYPESTSEATQSYVEYFENVMSRPQPGQSR